MMNYNEIIKLLDAGYSREEIMEMDKKPEPKPEEPEQKNESFNMDDTFKEMKDMFNDMRKELTAMNIMYSRQPADEERTSDEIIANIINPDIKK